MCAKIITNFFNELFTWLIIDRFSPNHTPLAIIGDEIISFIFQISMGEKESIFIQMKDYKYIRIILYLFSLIGVIIHNEIVVINICGLASDTKYFLDIMVKNDEEYSKSDNPNIIKRFETLEMIDFEDDESVDN